MNKYSDKSHVTMEQHQCFVCGEIYDTGAILMDTKLRQRFHKHTVTGQGLCPEHQAKKDEGYVALIVADPETEIRTGNVVHIRSSVWDQIFNTPVPPKMVCFCTPDTVEKLRELM